MTAKHACVSCCIQAKHFGLNACSILGILAYYSLPVWLSQNCKGALLWLAWWRHKCWRGPATCQGGVLSHRHVQSSKPTYKMSCMRIMKERKCQAETSSQVRSTFKIGAFPWHTNFWRTVRFCTTTILHRDTPYHRSFAKFELLRYFLVWPRAAKELGIVHSQRPGSKPTMSNTSARTLLMLM